MTTPHFIEPAQTRAFIMRRDPVRFDPETGVMTLMARAFEWQEIPYRSPKECNHVATLCEGCLEERYYLHNILLESRENPSIRIDLDELAQEYLAGSGEQEDLGQLADEWFGPVQ